MLPADINQIHRLVEPHLRGPIPKRVLERFRYHERLGFLFFPPQLRALQRLVSGEDLYSLLWDESL
jgi:hypothetical protein